MAIDNDRARSFIEGAKALGFFPAKIPPSGIITFSGWQVAAIDHWLANLPAKTGYELDKIEHGIS
jgi:hypothetical protein